MKNVLLTAICSLLATTFLVAWYGIQYQETISHVDTYIVYCVNFLILNKLMEDA
jgi:hypothetical protein